MFRRFIVLCSVLVFLTLAGCGSPDPAPVAQAATPPTAVPTEPPTSTPTETAVPPTETATHTPTAVPTNTATATTPPTDAPTSTPTDEPTETPEPTETAVPTLAATSPPAPADTAVPPPPAAPPASGAPPTGPNLLANPGFEYGTDGWRNATTYTSSVYPNFIRTGAGSGTGYAAQLVQNVQPGVTYRAGVWLKVWSSEREDRTISENPGDYGGRICINVNGDSDLTLPSTICSQFFRPIDAWQYITIDAVPAVDRIVVMLHGMQIGPNLPYHNEVIWDDVEFGLSPISATPTPQPPGRPVPPAPIAFDATGMRDAMNNSRSMLEQMGGLLDRLVRGSRETCDEYTGYYRGLVASPRYDGVPGEWQAVYNEYIFAVEHGSSTNQPIFETCYSGNGRVSELSYGTAREGINTSLNRLIPAIETANAMLGQ